MRFRFAGMLLLVASAITTAPAQTRAGSDESRNNVAWNTLGSSENDSMPIGNGDLAANVWTEQNGDLVLLIAKSDSWSEVGKLVKLARVRVHLSDNPFVAAKGFSQILDVHKANIEIRSGKNRLIVWVDANHPAMHIEGTFVRPTAVQANLELWRRSHPYAEPSPDRGGSFGLEGFGPNPPDIKIDFAADTVLPATSGTLAWYHRNVSSVFPLILRKQHLEQFQQKYPDPLLGRTFGATLTGAGMISKGDRVLQSRGARRDLRLDLVALTTTAPDSVQVWHEKIDSLTRGAQTVPLQAARQEHEAWWDAFWNRSWIKLGGSQEAQAVEQGYVLQRYMMAASSRGAFPAKYNGGLFTVGRDMPGDVVSTDKLHNPDYRKWGNSYWNQNNRHLYWPLLASGDFDLVKPWFDMYTNALPLIEDRTRAYYGHAGAAFIETIDFWGLPNLNDFGWNNAGVDLASPWMRYHTQGGLEIVAQMLDQYEMTQDGDFARKTLLPFSDAILTYYAQHWKKTDGNGKILFYPSQSIEMYQVNAVNPTPDLAGLYSVTQRLLQLPDTVVSKEQHQAWQALRDRLPPIAIGTAHNGKIPPQGIGDAGGVSVILPAKQYGDGKNIENPELYAIFPYRLYGVGRDKLQLARDTFAARLHPQDTCWGQDGEEAAILGLAGVAQKTAVHAFTNYGSQRFKWFWAAAHDWTPDLDDGGAGMMTLQNMLLQADGRRILLLPAWPEDWTADFKLHAPYQTTVEGHVEGGRISQLRVTPEARASDVVVLGRGH